MPRQLCSTVKKEGTIELSIAEIATPEPKPDQVLIRVEAAPINPSDLFAFLAGADLSTARSTGSGVDTVVTADVPERMLGALAARVDRPLPLGNEGAGVVVGAGSSPEAQALMGKVVATWGGRMYAQYRVANAADCLPMNEGTSPLEAASSFVNPLTVLGMIGTMRLEGHTAIVHTAAASNLGQMLLRVCNVEGIPLVNVVRRPEQVEFLKGLGAEHVCDSSQSGFMQDLIKALDATDATLAFDATGGGHLASRILTAMEAVQSRKGPVNNYGSNRLKQIYIYGGLDTSETTLSRGYGMAWSVAGWLVTNFLERVGPEEEQRLKQKVADEIKTTFASGYTKTVSLAEALDIDAIVAFEKKATGEKYLIQPNKGLD